MGSAIARELSRHKIEVALFEKEEELAFGVSKSNSGIIHPGTQNPASSLKGKLCVKGNRLTRKIARELELDFKEVGELIVAFSEEELFRLGELKSEAEKLGVPRLKIVGHKWLEKNEPNLNRKAKAALFAPTAGIISPYRLVYGLSENAQKNGVEIHTSAKAVEIDGERGAFEVFTTDGLFESKYIINAAGLFADDVAEMAGVDTFRIKARKGEEFLLDKKWEDLTRHLLFPLPSEKTKGILVIRTADGNPMIGPTAKEIEDKRDLATTDEGFKEVLSGAQKLVPGINGSDIIAYFAGLRPASGDDFIVREEKEVPGFINVAGIQSPGLTAAPAIALMVVGILKKSGLLLKKKKVFQKHRPKKMHLFAIPPSETKKLIKKNAAYGDIVCRCEMVSKGEVSEAIASGARTLDGIKFRTRAQAGRCHGSFCTTRLMKILSEKTEKPLTEITKRGEGSEIIKKDRCDG